MAVLKVTASHEPSAREAKNYLEGMRPDMTPDRSLALDTNFAGRGDWSQEMDAWRDAVGKDSGRTYYHAIISPDPKDGCTLEQQRELACRWAHERYPETMWAIEYHDDREAGMHAHVILNSVTYDGSKLHIDPARLREDDRVLQDICRDMGLSELVARERTQCGAQVLSGMTYEQASREERKRQREVREKRRISGAPIGGVHKSSGRWAWRNAVRRIIDACIVGCQSMAHLARRLVVHGVTMREYERRGEYGVTFTYGRHRVKGWRLDPEGGAYTWEGLCERIAQGLCEVARRAASSVSRLAGVVRDASKLACVTPQGILCAIGDDAHVERRNHAASTVAHVTGDARDVARTSAGPVRATTGNEDHARHVARRTSHVTSTRPISDVIAAPVETRAPAVTCFASRRAIVRKFDPDDGDDYLALDERARRVMATRRARTASVETRTMDIKRTQTKGIRR